MDRGWLASAFPTVQSHPFPESSFNQSDQATAHIANKGRYAFFQDRYTNQGKSASLFQKNLRIRSFQFGNEFSLSSRFPVHWVVRNGSKNERDLKSLFEGSAVPLFKKTGLQAARERLDGPKQQEMDGRDHPEAHSTIGRYGEWRLKGLLDERQKALLMIRRTE